MSFVLLFWSKVINHIITIDNLQLLSKNKEIFDFKLPHVTDYKKAVFSLKLRYISIFLRMRDCCVPWECSLPHFICALYVCALTKSPFLFTKLNAYIDLS